MNIRSDKQSPARDHAGSGFDFNRWRGRTLRSAVAVAGLLAWLAPARAAVQGWLDWRGPEQSGVSRETGLPDKIASAADALWVADLAGKSTPVIANGRLYVLGYVGEGPDLKEVVACFDAETGQPIWRHGFTDFISDTIYMRYATSAPVIDAETGNVYMQGTQGILAAFTADGKPLWSHSLMEELGRLTFPNGRTATPSIDGELVITRGIMSNWGAQGPASDRFYAFDKRTGELVWASTPGGRPMDNSFSSPYFTWLNGRRVFIASLGDGSIACVNARTGEPIWGVPLAKAGINATAVVYHNDTVIALYGTPYEPGQMVAMRIPNVAPKPGDTHPVIVDRAAVELWSNSEISSSASSPILVGDRIYTVKEKGDLVAVDVKTGKVMWHVTLGIEQRNSCPVYADGKIYVPILDDPQGPASTTESDAATKGGFYIIRDAGNSGEVLSHIALDGRCFGTPVAYNGKVYVQTVSKLYCFGKAGNNPGLPKPVAETPWPKAGPATQLQIVPAEVLLHPGEKATFRVRKLDAHGLFVEDVKDPAKVKWSAYVPPTALVKAKMDAAFNAAGELVVAPDAKMSAGAFEAEVDGLRGYIRGRVLPQLPFQEDFESYALSNVTTNSVEPPTKFAYPPLPWIGARFKFDVRDLDGSHVLAKTLDNRFFQRAMAFIDAPDLKNYTLQADVRSDGTRRKMSEVGLVNQRYLIALKGNSQQLEVSSNQERLRANVHFRWLPNVWYTLKTRVDVAADGTGVVRAKVWPRGEPEPAAWTIEVPHKTAHQQGAPGLYGFSPQDMRVFIDNIRVTPNS